MSAIEQAAEAIRSINIQALQSEVATLRAIKAWAMNQLNVDYQPGDRVVIVSPEPSEVGNGWAHYSEALSPGQTGIVGKIEFHARISAWRVMIGLDRSWSNHTEHDGSVTRYWNGPASETPAGHKPPSPYDQKHHPDGKTKWFCMHLDWVRKADDGAPIGEVAE